MNLTCPTKNIMKWFKLNSFKTDPGKFQFMILGDKTFYEHILQITFLKLRY